MKKYFLIALVALTTVVSCKKENNDTDPSSPSNPSTPGTSKVLKRIIETEDGVTTSHSLTYDASKRLTSIKSSDNSEVVSLTYDGNGNVTKIESKEDGERKVFEFTYNNNQPTSGSFKGFEKNETQTEVLTSQYNLAYTIVNSLVTKIKMIVPADPETEDEGYELDYNLTYSNGNLTKVEAAGASIYTASFTYGNKKPMLPAIFKYVLDPAGFSLQFFAKNEILTMTYDFPGTTLDNTITNVYTYDTQGYVLTSNDGETQTRFEYE